MSWKTQVTIAASVAALGLAAPVLHAGDAGETISRYCSDHGDFGLSHGACVARFTNGNIVPHHADVCKLDWVLAFSGAKNHGDCVKRLKEMDR